MQTKARVEEFRDHMPLVQTLFNPGMRDRHWEQISTVVGFPLHPTPDSNLAKFIDMNLEQHIPAFEQVSEAASKEFALEKALNKMKDDWKPVRASRASPVARWIQSFDKTLDSH